MHVGRPVDQVLRQCRGRWPPPSPCCTDRPPCRRSGTSRWRCRPGSRGSGGNAVGRGRVLQAGPRKSARIEFGFAELDRPVRFPARRPRRRRGSSSDGPCGPRARPPQPDAVGRAAGAGRSHHEVVDHDGSGSDEHLCPWNCRSGRVFETRHPASSQSSGLAKPRPGLRKHAPLDSIDFLAANLSTSLARLTVGRGSWSMV